VSWWGDSVVFEDPFPISHALTRNCTHTHIHTYAHTHRHRHTDKTQIHTYTHTRDTEHGIVQVLRAQIISHTCPNNLTIHVYICRYKVHLSFEIICVLPNLYPAISSLLHIRVVHWILTFFKGHTTLHTHIHTRTTRTTHIYIHRHTNAHIHIYIHNIHTYTYTYTLYGNMHSLQLVCACFV